MLVVDAGFQKSLDISLTLLRNESDDKKDTISYKMKWNKPHFSNGSGYYKGWDFFRITNEIMDSKNHGFKHTHLAPLCFFIYFVFSLILSVILIKKNLNYYYFLLLQILL
ncbi:MAG: hypothetical protein Q8935_12235 [Bacillota bacterium]|nr:hypothetical protein [Bacillota bacterium]